MRARRLIGSAIVTALAATTLGFVGTGSANAVETVQTRIVPGSSTRPVISSYSKPIRYGQSISLSVNVEGFIDGAWKQIYNGPITVTETVVGKAPRTVAATTSEAYLYDSIPARGNAVYTVSYAGGTGGYPQVNYAPTSASYSVKGVQRALETKTLSGKRAGFTGKIKPAAKTKIIAFKKVGKKFKKFKTFKTNKKGKFKVVLPAPRRGQFRWKIVFKGNRQFAASVIKGRTYKRHF